MRVFFTFFKLCTWYETRKASHIVPITQNWNHGIHPIMFSRQHHLHKTPTEKFVCVCLCVCVCLYVCVPGLKATNLLSYLNEDGSFINSLDNLLLWYLTRRIMERMPVKLYLLLEYKFTLRYITMDQTRKLLLFMETDPKAFTIPLVGMWVYYKVRFLKNQLWWQNHVACGLSFNQWNDILFSMPYKEFLWKEKIRSKIS